MTKITTEEVEKLASLSRLTLTKDEIESNKQDIQNILGFIEELQSVDVSGYEPTDQVTGLQNVIRPDKLDDLPTPEVLLGSMNTDANQFKVPKVL